MIPYIRFPKYIIAGFYSAFAILLFGVLFTLNVNAKSLTEWIEEIQANEPRIKEIIFIVARNEDQPTREIHDEFWKLITRLEVAPFVWTAKPSSISGFQPIV